MAQRKVNNVIIDFYSKGLLKLEAFIMIEVSLAIAVLSIVFSSSIVFLLKIQEMHQQTITDRNMWMLISSIAGFMSRNGRLPYPSRPDMDGVELDHPEDDNDWRRSWEKYTRGTIPWRTLGISEYYSRDGKGNYYTYVVDPTLCGRKSVKSVPIGEISEVLDWSDNYSKLGRFDKLDYGFEFKFGSPDEIQTISENIKKVEQEKYASYRAVRSYLNDCGYDTGTKTKCWDIASKIKDCKLIIYIDGKKFEPPKRHFVILKSKELKNNEDLFRDEALQPPESLACQFFASLMQNWMSDNEETDEDSPYKVDDFIAFALISHKDKSRCFKKEKKLFNLNNDANKFNSKLENKIQNSETQFKEGGTADISKKGNNAYSKTPNLIYIDSFGGDKVEFIGRFQLADIARCRCAGFKVVLI